MSIDLELADEQVALAESVRRFCADHCTDEVVRAAGVPDELWRGLADLGLFLLATPEGGGGALEVVAAMEELGAASCPGPLVSTFFAAQALQGEARLSLGKGETIVSVGRPPLLPWAPAAHEILEIGVDGVWRCAPRGEIEVVHTLGLEPWGRVELDRLEHVASLEPASTIANLAAAAYVVGAGSHALRTAASYAQDREQFGTAIGSFQAVAHPLASSAMELTAARTLTRIAAHRFDQQADPGAARAGAATARLSATEAALDAVYRAHQTFGAMGFTVEGPVGHVSRRIRQVSLLPPELDAARAEVLAAHDL